MSDEKPRKKRNKGKQVMDAAAWERLSARKPARKKEEVAELPTWAKIAIVKHELLGQTWPDIAAEMGRSEQYLHDLKGSPAAKKFLAPLREFAADPVELAKAVLKGAAVGLAVENLLHYEAAKSSGDIGEAGRQLRYLTDTVGIPVPQKAEDMPRTITLQFAGGMNVTASLELPMGESSSQKLLPTIEAEVIE